MFVYCHGCDRAAERVRLLREEWLNVYGYWFCPQCQESIERCVICDEPNWLDHDWHTEPDGGLICPDCEEAMRAESQARKIEESQIVELGLEGKGDEE